jgi:hypothetical protein
MLCQGSTRCQAAAWPSSDAASGWPLQAARASGGVPDLLHGVAGKMRAAMYASACFSSKQSLSGTCRQRELAVARLVLGGDVAEAGGYTRGESFLSTSDSSHCGKMAALEQLLAAWHGERNKVGGGLLAAGCWLVAAAGHRGLGPGQPS